jgi:hypothetical protein
MIIEVDIKYLSECKISVHQYVILKLAYEKKLKLLERYLISSGTLEFLMRDLTYLHFNDYLDNPPDANAILNTIRVSDKYARVFQSNIDSFEEFYGAFPVRVLRPDGNYDYLRVDHKRSKLLYNNIVGSDASKHQLLMSCLKLEIEDRTRRSQLSFMKRMPMWLSSEAWKVYADSDLGGQNSTRDEFKIAYGQNFE